MLTDPAETGAVTLALPQDVPGRGVRLSRRAVRRPRVWRVRRPPPEPAAASTRSPRSSRAREAAADRGRRRRHLLRGDRRRCARSPSATGIPVAETQAGKGVAALRPPGAPRRDRRDRHRGRQRGRPRRRPRHRRRHALERLHDRVAHGVPASPTCDFVSVNVAAFDAAQARRRCRSWPTPARRSRRSRRASPGWRVDAGVSSASAASSRREWDAEVERPTPARPRAAAAPGRGDRRGQRRRPRRDVVVCAAGSLPGDLHKLWRTRDPKGYHVEYGYSCMGYEIAGRARREDGRPRPRGRTSWSATART